ncbi:MAG: RNA polymerase sigma factor [Phycisphaerales bacterium]
MPDAASDSAPKPPGGASDALEATLRRCLDGDPDGWAAFVRDSAGLVHAAVRRAAGAQGGPSAHRDVDDTVQDVYLRLVRRDMALLRRFDPTRASLSTWLTVVARSVTIDMLRRRELDTVSIDGAAHPATNLASPTPATAEEPSSGGHDDEVQIGSLSLHGLSERQRLVIRMLFADGRTVAEVAAMLRVDEQTVRSTKHKALVRLRAEHAPPDD